MKHKSKSKKTAFASASGNSVPQCKRNRQARHRIKQTSLSPRPLPTQFPRTNAATHQHHKHPKKTPKKDFTSAPCNSVPLYKRSRQARHKIKQTSFYQRPLPTQFPHTNAATHQHHKRPKKTFKKDFTSTSCNSITPYERNLKEAPHPLSQNGSIQDDDIIHACQAHDYPSL